MVQRIEIAISTNALAVRWIGNDASETTFAGRLMHGACLEVNVIGDTRSLRVFPRRPEDLSVDVAGQNLFLQSVLGAGVGRFKI